ncbi:hypothetical protein P154DRAFT_440413, partial [Amniculicola lignicola CBS 123094]
PSALSDHKYICVPRPFFDVEAECASKKSKTDPFAVYKKINEKERKDDLFMRSASEVKKCKWIMLWAGWKMYIDLGRQAKYCDPDNFSMYIYNDFRPYGLVEQLENMVVAFDKEYKKKTRDETTLFQMWAVVSAIGLAIQDENGIGAYVLIDDGERTFALTGLIGSAFLTALHAIEEAGELKKDSKFLDLPLVMGYFLEYGYNLPDFSIDGDGAAWPRHAIAYYTKSKASPSQGIFSTPQRLKDLAERYEDEEDEDEYINKRSKKDPWAWTARLKDYKNQHGGQKLGGKHHDITKMSKRERAAHAFDGKDPLAGVPAQVLKDGLLDWE